MEIFKYNEEPKGFASRRMNWRKQMDRRDFLKTGSALAFPTIIGSPTFASEPDPPKLSREMELLISNLKTMIRNCKTYYDLTHSIFDPSPVFECGQLDLFLWWNYRFETNDGNMEISLKTKDFDDDRIERVGLSFFSYRYGSKWITIETEHMNPIEIRKNLFENITEKNKVIGCRHLIGTELLGV